MYYIYIMASKRNGTLYTGVTNDIIRRAWQHRTRLTEGFTKEYSIHHLVYYEVHSNIYEAIKREKNIKAWKRKWKLQLIEQKNPQWNDLYEEIAK